MCAQSCWAPLAARCVCAISSPGVASIGASHNRGNSALGSGARSGRRCVRWSRRACRSHGLMVPAPTGWGVAPIFHEPASDAGLRSLGGGAVLPLRANDTTWPTAGPIVCRRPVSGRPPRWIRRASIEPPRQTGAPLTFLRRAAYSPNDVACSNLSGRNASSAHRFNDEGSVRLPLVDLELNAPKCVGPGDPEK
jgi:hypothetical protein